MTVKHTTAQISQQLQYFILHIKYSIIKAHAEMKPTQLIN